MTAERIRILATGGTFDKHYDEIRGSLTFKDSHLPEILKFVRCSVPIALELNQLVDSLEMHASSRLRVLESCRGAPHAGAPFGTAARSADRHLSAPRHPCQGGV